MKKLTLALVASALSIGATSAHINTGFYLGGAVGYGATTGRATVTNVTGVNAHGDTAANIGIHGGYGWVQNCTYFGAEVAYTFENTKITNSLFGTAGASQTLKRDGYFGVALRAGYLFTPATMAYIRLGGNWGKWKLNDNNFAFAGTTSAGSKNRLSFAPGFGLETAVHKNVYLRGEYTYEFGPTVSAKAGNNPATALTFGRVRSQSAKVGLSYKF